jgi:hypothetical protein
VGLEDGGAVAEGVAEAGVEAAPAGLGSGTLPGLTPGAGALGAEGSAVGVGVPETAPAVVWAAVAPVLSGAALGCGPGALWRVPEGVVEEGAAAGGWAPESGAGEAGAPAAAAAAAAAAATCAGEGVAGASLPAGSPVAVTGRAFSGVVRGTWRTGGAAVAGRPSRAAASALTRCSCSAERSGARPAHSRNRLSSRAWVNTSNDRTAIPTSAANAAIAPICVNELDSDSASSEVAVMNPGSVRAAQA